MWIEHRPEKSTEGQEPFEFVVFASFDVTERAPYLGVARACTEEPTWKPLDRASVEDLVGGKV